MIVLACEGKTEKILLQRLLDEGMLFFTRGEVFDHGPIHSRQLREYRPMLQSIDFQEHISIMRIGDTLTDELNLDFFRHRVESGLIDVTRYCTKPEIEIIAIIANGWMADYRKTKLSPKTYIRQFHGDFDFIGFIQNGPIETIVSAICEYRRVKRNGAGEFYLAELLKP